MGAARIRVCAILQHACILSAKLILVVMTTAKLNLASNPFLNRVFPWTVSALIALVSILALLIIAQKTFKANAQRLEAEREVSALRQATDLQIRRVQDA